MLTQRRGLGSWWPTDSQTIVQAMTSALTNGSPPLYGFVDSSTKWLLTRINPCVARGVHDERQLCAVGLVGVLMLANLGGSICRGWVDWVAEVD
jgi:hypothetical protein